MYFLEYLNFRIVSFLDLLLSKPMSPKRGARAQTKVSTNSIHCDCSAIVYRIPFIDLLLGFGAPVFWSYHEWDFRGLESSSSIRWFGPQCELSRLRALSSVMAKRSCENDLNIPPKEEVRKREHCSGTPVYLLDIRGHNTILGDNYSICPKSMQYWDIRDQGIHFLHGSFRLKPLLLKYSIDVVGAWASLQVLAIQSQTVRNLSHVKIEMSSSGWRQRGSLKTRRKAARISMKVLKRKSVQITPCLKGWRLNLKVHSSACPVIVLVLKSNAWPSTDFSGLWLGLELNTTTSHQVIGLGMVDFD